MNMTFLQYGYDPKINGARICIAVVITIVFLTIQDLTNQHQQWSDWSQNIFVKNQGTTIISHHRLLSNHPVEGGQLALIAASPSLTNDNMHTASISQQRAKHPVDDQIQKPVSDGRAELNEKVIPPFLPNQVLDQYKKVHNNDVLDMEFKRMEHYNESIDRKFSIVHYKCPGSAGNVFHNLYNSIAWSIITNRTMLFRYDNTGGWDTQEGCDRMVTLSSWIPKYDDWYIPLKFNTDTDKPIPIPLDSEKYQLENEQRTVTFPQTNDIRPRENIYRNHWGSDPMQLLNYREYIQKMDEQNQVIAKSLYHEGIDFLFGMMFREFFDPNQEIMSRITEMIPQNFFSTSTNVFSMGLHSRHPVVEDKGNYINEEIQCLNDTLPEEGRTLDTCFIFLMSDRTLMLDSLSKWLVENNCTPVSVKEDGGTRFLKVSEHGPRAGDGFMKDLFLASHARSGYIMSNRSSSRMVIELITYDRNIDAWKKNISQNRNDIIQPELRICNLNFRSHIEGYDYGPGTPTFRINKPNA